jgi:hypothetical protein
MSLPSAASLQSNIEAQGLRTGEVKRTVWWKLLPGLADKCLSRQGGKQMSATKPVKQPSTAEPPLPSMSEFRASVKYVLVHDRGMPDLIAELVITADTAWLERQRQSFFSHEDPLTAAADGLVLTPPGGVQWIPFHPGMRIAAEKDLLVPADGAIDSYLNALVKVGLHGADRATVASAMLARGIESVFPLIADLVGKEKKL